LWKDIKKNMEEKASWIVKRYLKYGKKAGW
jgi:hypothetical protein